MSGDALSKFAGAEPYRTSSSLNWSGIQVLRYRLSAGETKEHSYSQLVVFLSHVDRPVNGELRLAGRKVNALIGNHTVSIAPPGLPLSSSWDGAGEVTAIYLKTGPESSRILPQYWIQDPLIHAIGTALEEELAAPRAASGPYAESLGAALVAHIFSRYSDTAFAAQHARKQYTAQIARSLEFIGNHLDHDLSLDELAKVANMSKFHFAKSFRQAMGIAPPSVSGKAEGGKGAEVAGKADDVSRAGGQ